jgi:hypothetical protein
MDPRINPHVLVATQSGPQVHIPNSYIQPGHGPLTCMPVFRPGAVQPGAILSR